MFPLAVRKQRLWLQPKKLWEMLTLSPVSSALQPQRPRRHRGNHLSIRNLLISLAPGEISCIQSIGSMATGEAELEKSKAK